VLQQKTIEIQVQEQEIKRREKELDATIKRAADAKRYEIETLAEAARRKVEMEAEAERMRLSTVAEGDKAKGLAAAAVAQATGQAQAEAEKARGLAEAQIRQAQGLAEALAMEKKAEAWRKYSEAAVLQILAPILPEIARAVAEPLSRIDRITMVNTGGASEVGVSRVTGEVARVIAQVPPVIESLTGLKLEELLSRVRPGAGAETPAVDLPKERPVDGGVTAPAATAPRPPATTKS
jgi:flotillin